MYPHRDLLVDAPSCALTTTDEGEGGGPSVGVFGGGRGGAGVLQYPGVLQHIVQGQPVVGIVPQQLQQTNVK